MTDTYLPLMKGALALLKATSGVTNLTGQRIYSDVPQKQTFPYVVCSIDSSDFSAQDFTGMDHTLQFNIYSRDKSPEETARIRSAIYTSLNRQESVIELDAGTMTHIHFNGVSTTFKDVDGVTWVGVIQFRAVIT